MDTLESLLGGLPTGDPRAIFPAIANAFRASTPLDVLLWCGSNHLACDILVQHMFNNQLSIAVAAMRATNAILDQLDGRKIRELVDDHRRASQMCRGGESYYRSDTNDEARELFPLLANQAFAHKLAARMMQLSSVPEELELEQVLEICLRCVNHSSEFAEALITWTPATITPFFVHWFEATRDAPGRIVTAELVLTLLEILCGATRQFAHMCVEHDIFAMLDPWHADSLTWGILRNVQAYDLLPGEIASHWLEVAATSASVAAFAFAESVAIRRSKFDDALWEQSMRFVRARMHERSLICSSAIRYMALGGAKIESSLCNIANDAAQSMIDDDDRDQCALLEFLLAYFSLQPDLDFSWKVCHRLPRYVGNCQQDAVLRIGGRLACAVCYSIHHDLDRPHVQCAKDDATAFLQLVHCVTTWLQPGDEEVCRKAVDDLLLNPTWLVRMGVDAAYAYEMRAVLLQPLLARLDQEEGAIAASKLRAQRDGSHLSKLRIYRGHSCLPLEPDWVFAQLPTHCRARPGTASHAKLQRMVRALLQLSKDARELLPLSALPRSRLLLLGMRIIAIRGAGVWRCKETALQLSELYDWVTRSSDRMIGCTPRRVHLPIIQRMAEVYASESFLDPECTRWVLLPLRTNEPEDLKLASWGALELMAMTGKFPSAEAIGLKNQEDWLPSKHSMEQPQYLELLKGVKMRCPCSDSFLLQISRAHTRLEHFPYEKVTLG